jgi:hypothetical protein
MKAKVKAWDGFKVEKNKKEKYLNGLIFVWHWLASNLMALVSC